MRQPNDLSKSLVKKISKPHLQHGTYSFFFWDGDDNCWEILTNPEGGYSWLFEQGDQPGRGHLDRNFKRPGRIVKLTCVEQRSARRNIRSPFSNRIAPLICGLGSEDPERRA